MRRTLHGTTNALVTALALTTALGLLLEPFRAGSAVHVHWLGSGSAATLVATLFAAAVLARGRGPRWRWSAHAGALASLLLAAASAWEVARSGRGLVNASLLAALLLGAWLVLERRTPAPVAGRVPRPAGVAAASGALVAVWLACVGAVDYGAGPPADAIVVLGSKVHPDGRPSGSLLDRTVTACRLWHRGAGRVLVLSGGHGAGAGASEPEAMRRIALAHGVPESALVLDPHGATTAATAANVAALARARGWERILAVSHDYHLARIRLLGERAGVVLRTVPAEETHPTGWKWAARAREVVAWSAAWLL